MAYKFYVKKANRNSEGVVDSSTPTYDIEKKFGIVCKDFPIQILPELKELSKTDYKDQHGEKVFFPEKLTASSYDITIEFAYEGKFQSGPQVCRDFIDYFTGNDGEGGGTDIMFFDEYTNLGIASSYLKSHENTMFYSRKGDVDVLTFKLKFRVVDPFTKVSISNDEKIKVV